MAAPRKPFKREADRAIVARMYLERRTIEEIARHLGINRLTVMADLKIIQQRWMEDANRAISERKSEELARIDRLELAAWDGYYRSIKVREQTKTVLEEGEGRSRRKAESRKEELVGDTRWLSIVQWCVDARAKIIGFYAPAKSEGRVEHEHYYTVQSEFDREFKRLVERIDARGEGPKPRAGEALPRGFTKAR